MAITVTGGVSIQTVSVTSASTPVALIPGDAGAAAKQTYNIRPRVGAASPILVWPFQGATPGSVPSPLNVREISGGESFQDQVTNPLIGAIAGIGVGWAAVLETGSTAVTVDVVWR